mmetsp:Transcript_47282/g.125445  ORF Transcript_47282/g.125445 Transcript_47282/m.125445 type:complete len:282 (-) Transcript_47282:205-1050(-)
MIFLTNGPGCLLAFCNVLTGIINPPLLAVHECAGHLVSSCAVRFLEVALLRGRPRRTKLLRCVAERHAPLLPPLSLASGHLKPAVEQLQLAHEVVDALQRLVLQRRPPATAKQSQLAYKLVDINQLGSLLAEQRQYLHGLDWHVGQRELASALDELHRRHLAVVVLVKVVEKVLQRVPLQQRMQARWQMDALARGNFFQPLQLLPVQLIVLGDVHLSERPLNQWNHVLHLLDDAVSLHIEVLSAGLYGTFDNSRRDEVHQQNGNYPDQHEEENANYGMLKD